MRKLLMLTVVALLAVVAAGCGASGGSDAADTTDEATTTEAEETTTTEDEETTTTEVDGPTSDNPYFDAIVSNLTTGSADDGDLVIEDAAGECVAAQWVEIVSVEEFEAVDPTGEEIADPGFTYTDLGLDPDQAQAMLDSFESCDIDIYAQLAESLTLGMTPEQQSCAMDNIDDDVANALLLTAFSAELGEGDAEFEALIEQLTTVCDLPE